MIRPLLAFRIRSSPCLAVALLVLGSTTAGQAQTEDAMLPVPALAQHTEPAMGADLDRGAALAGELYETPAVPAPEADANGEAGYFAGAPADADGRLYLAQGTTTTTTPTRSGPGALRGFADVPWGSSFSEVSTRLKALATSTTAIERVEILAELRNVYILVRRNDVLYRYNFYKTPYNVALLQNHELSEEDHDREEAVFFHLKVMTPFIQSKLVKDKLTALYGLNTRTTVDKKLMGADIWEPEGGLIFQWYEPYVGKAFTRTVDYLSLPLAKTIMAEYADYFDAHEKLIMQKILLQ